MACSKVFSELAGIWPDTFGGLNKCNKGVVAASSHHRSPSSIIRKSKIRAAK